MSKMQSKQWWITSGAILLVLGSLWYILAPKLQTEAIRRQGEQQNTRQLAAATQQVTPDTQTAMTFGEPTALTLPRLAISLPIAPGYYRSNSKTWTLDSQHAFSMQSPSNAIIGTPIIYGHNIPAVFRKLDGIAKDETLRITTKDGRELLFRYVGDRVVLPNDDSVLRTSLHNTILLMTCTGSQFQHRRVLQFEYIGVKQVSFATTPTQRTNHDFSA